jgi:hypothetical protein
MAYHKFKILSDPNFIMGQKFYFFGQGSSLHIRFTIESRLFIHWFGNLSWYVAFAKKQIAK